MSVINDHVDGQTWSKYCKGVNPWEAEVAKGTGNKKISERSFMFHILF